MSPAAPTLTLLQTRPDLALLHRWAQASGQRALREDLGYALHAAAKATLGGLAPKPFALVQRAGGLALFVGYSSADAADLERVAAFSAGDALAARSLGLAALSARALPSDWRVGELLRFEVRCAPVVRSRSQGGGYPEVDAVHHPLYAADDREVAYLRWLARELARDDAAELEHGELVAFRLAAIARRAAQAGGAIRTTQCGLLPDAQLRGQLRVRDGAAFQRLLARGLGRHRAFGFGCLLLAPAG
ncbi:MAG: type I-E CRISPR-associated protein Cas6/Cse3/CasE [Roseateles sp.]|uniref:type I-E CRISPR-associated protein Cas6/Cse3/CasE n=1 Tax=Roseateles sp. TaxID=1971397 RepID=UPI0039E8104E